MKFDDKTIKEILLKENYVTEEDIKNADDFAKSHNTSFIEYLLHGNLITKDLLGQAVAEAYKIPYTDLNSHAPTSEQILKIPEDIAKEFRVVLFSEDEKGLIIATDNPDTKGLSEALGKIFVGKKIAIAYSLSEDIDAVFTHYRKPLNVRFTKIFEKQGRVAPEILDEIFNDAFSYKASDIHFEPQGKNVLVRFRVDGVLHETGRIPKEYYENIINRIKVMSNIRIDQHFSAQDGALRYEKDGKVIDMRTSIAPTIEGEKVVLRVLSAYVEGLTLSEIGLSGAHQRLLEEAADKPFGMILIVGPTGSGKTTTLYALLRLLNNPDTNITTIEDPVEYRVQGINQIQVNPQTGLTFATGLRSIVRQDPDTILVGEIRDKETAETAVNAALTGHLLLSSFHANDAATAVPRLLDMGIEPFLLSSTLQVMIAQRLLRRICEHCRHSVNKGPDDFNTARLRSVREYFKEKKITLYEGKGCEVCSGTGYKGRTAIFEFIRMSPAMQELVSSKPSAQSIWKLARTDGSESLFEDGISKVKSGQTTIDELLRVSEPPKLKELIPNEK